MAKSLDDLNAGKGMMLPAPIVTPGTVPGAGVFDGRLQSRGLLLGSPQSSAQGITTDRLDWVRDTTGVLYAMITQYRSTVVSPAQSTLGIQVSGDGSEFPASKLALSAVSNTDGASLVVQANETPSASILAITGGGSNQSVLMASDKSSDYVRKGSWLLANGLTAELVNADVAAAAAIAVSKLAAGTNTFILQTVAGVPTWVAYSAGVPLTTVTATGDLIVGTGSGTVGRLAVGTAAQVLIGGSTPAWASVLAFVNAAGISIFSNKLVSTHANAAFIIGGDGQFSWGAGDTSAVDTTLARSAAGQLKLVGGSASASALLITPPNATDFVNGARAAADTVARYVLAANGAMTFGDGTNPRDVGIGRLSAGLLDVHDNAGTGQGGLAGVAAYRNSFTFNTTSAEQNLISFSVPAAALQTARGLLFFVDGDFLFNSGAPTLTLRVKYGATTLWGTASAAIALSATRRAFLMSGYLGNKGATNAQTVSGSVDLSDAAAGSVAGVGNFGAAAIRGNFAGTATIDSTAAQTFAVTGQMSVSNLSDEMRGVATVVIL